MSLPLALSICCFQHVFRRAFYAYSVGLFLDMLSTDKLTGVVNLPRKSLND